MRLLLINLMLLFFHSSSLAQSANNFDEVKIYFYPEVILPGIGNCHFNENETRVKASISISIKQKSEIHEIAEKLLDQSLEVYPHEVQEFSCQMVVDFILAGRINRTIAITPLNQVRIDEDVFSCYKSNDSILKFYTEYIIFFRQR